MSHSRMPNFQPNRSRKVRRIDNPQHGRSAKILYSVEKLQEIRQLVNTSRAQIPDWFPLFRYIDLNSFNGSDRRRQQHQHHQQQQSGDLWDVSNETLDTSNAKATMQAQFDRERQRHLTMLRENISKTKPEENGAPLMEKGSDNSFGRRIELDMLVGNSNSENGEAHSGATDAFAFESALLGENAKVEENSAKEVSSDFANLMAIFKSTAGSEEDMLNENVDSSEAPEKKQPSGNDETKTNIVSNKNEEPSNDIDDMLSMLMGSGDEIAEEPKEEPTEAAQMSIDDLMRRLQINDPANTKSKTEPTHHHGSKVPSPDARPFMPRTQQPSQLHPQDIRQQRLMQQQQAPGVERMLSALSPQVLPPQVNAFAPRDGKFFPLFQELLARSGLTREAAQGRLRLALQAAEGVTDESRLRLTAHILAAPSECSHIYIFTVRNRLIIIYYSKQLLILGKYLNC
eukprot:TRINITY_DN147_c0_g1_i1.p1 TRINITY_DN147_c0_g1~~TRINITY_DN147_c0_g1_i1.p1  ORF type:complete len:457 (-),score=130.14 TRINITY_DN147_c0_g1_i1:365-1735(-)